MKKKDLKKILAIESILIELMLREGWSSRVQAERIYEAVTSKEARKKILKPWEHIQTISDQFRCVNFKSGILRAGEEPKQKYGYPVKEVKVDNHRVVCFEMPLERIKTEYLRLREAVQAAEKTSPLPPKCDRTLVNNLVVKAILDHWNMCGYLPVEGW